MGNSRMIRTSLVAAALLSAFSSPALAAPRLSAAWSDHAVIQRDAPIRVEGTAGPRERISATLGERTATAQADALLRRQMATRCLERTTTQRR